MRKLALIAVLASVSALTTACETVYDYGNGRVAKVSTAALRDPFGTNVVYSKLDHCERYVVKEEGIQPLFPKYEYKDCHPLVDWSVGHSQGQGGQIAAGAMQALGVGLGLANMPVGSSNVTATGGNAASNTTVNVVGGKK